MSYTVCMAIRMPAKQRLTLRQFLELPESEPAAELIDGEVIQKPMGKVPHSRAQSRLLIILSNHEATRDGESLVEQGVNADGANHRVPDVSWYRPGRLDEVDGDYPDFAPDLAVEVRSEGQSLAFLRDKLAFLRAHGSAATLLVDPVRQVIEVVDGDRAESVDTSGVVRITALSTFEFPAATLFS